MQCPRLPELPPPPAGKMGWPWTEESPPLPDRMPDGRPWPRISIVTPSYNQGRFIEETIRSVLLQGYPDLEYLVIDGGSTDESLGIIQKYARWLAYWVSEADRGQAHAINKGFQRASGELLQWTNSDDILFPGALPLFGRTHRLYSDRLLLGDVMNVYFDGRPPRLVRQQNVTFPNAVECWHGGWTWHQPGLAVPRARWQAVGGLDETLRYLFDRDWLCRLTRRAEVHYLGVPVGQFRLHPLSKHGAEAPEIMREHWLVTQRYWDEVPGLRKGWVRAVHTIREAGVYLALDPFHARFWDRWRGARLLWTAFRGYPGIVRSSDFLRLCARALASRPPREDTP